MVAEYAAQRAVPPFSLTVVLSGDIGESIARYGKHGFHAERLGGRVAGVTLASASDYSEALIILDATAELNVMDIVHLAAHEYGHVLQGRLRAVAGTRPAVPVRDQTLEEAAAILAYEAADEYRCDLVSNEVLGTVTTTIDGPSRPVHLGDVYGEGYFHALTEICGSRVREGWPDLVDICRRGDIDSSAMMSRLANETSQVLKLIAHAQAFARASGQPPVLDRLAAEPAVERYLAAMWTPIRRVLDGSAVVPSLNEFADVDRALHDSGRAVVDMWGRLGVWSRLGDGQLHLEVGAPRR